MVDLLAQFFGVFVLYQFFTFINMVKAPLNFKECYVLQEKTLVSLNSKYIAQSYDERFLPDKEILLINSKKYIEVDPNYCDKIIKKN